MPTATMDASRLRLNPRLVAIGRKKGPIPMRIPTVSMVSKVEAATMFQPKYQLPVEVDVARLMIAAIRRRPDGLGKGMGGE